MMQMRGGVKYGPATMQDHMAADGLTCAFEKWAMGCAADFIPFPDPEYGHDPHCVRVHPLSPDILYQQNHCGIYRIDRPSD